MYTSHVVSLFPHLLPALLICHALLLSCCMQCAYPCTHGCKYPPLPSNNSELFNVLVQVRWCRPATPTLRRLRQEDYHPVKDKLCCTVNTKQVWADIIARSYLFPKIQRNKHSDVFFPVQCLRGSPDDRESFEAFHCFNCGIYLANY